MGVTEETVSTGLTLSPAKSDHSARVEEFGSLHTRSVEGYNAVKCASVTEPGIRSMPQSTKQQRRHGARIAFLTDGTNKVLLVEQTVKSEHQGQRKGQYVIDYRADNSKIERHVKWDDDQGLAQAVRSAVEGTLE